MFLWWGYGETGRWGGRWQTDCDRLRIDILLLSIIRGIRRLEEAFSGSSDQKEKRWFPRVMAEALLREASSICVSPAQGTESRWSPEQAASWRKAPCLPWLSTHLASAVDDGNSFSSLGSWGKTKALTQLASQSEIVRVRNSLTQTRPQGLLRGYDRRSLRPRSLSPKPSRKPRETARYSTPSGFPALAYSRATSAAKSTWSFHPRAQHLTHSLRVLGQILKLYTPTDRK